MTEKNNREIGKEIRDVKSSEVRPESYSTKRILYALTGGFIAGVLTYTTVATAAELMGAAQDTATIAGFITMIPATVAGYIFGGRKSK